jgi:hypothetical protein
LASAGLGVQPFRIDIVDDQNGWPVPAVELKTTHHMRFVSDNAGVIACDLPELMGVETWFYVEGHGYGVPADGFGYRGVRLMPTPGGRATVKVHRELPGKRLGRLTGAGLFAESQKFGHNARWREQGVLGCDTVYVTRYGERLFWLWGDTTLAKYPLGLFHTLGATTSIKPLQNFEPPLRLRFDYFADAQGSPRAIAPIEGEGPTWLSGLVELRDSRGQDHLVAAYAKIRGMLTAYEVGLCEWSNKEEVFKRTKVIWERKDDSTPLPFFPDGHVVSWTDAEGEEWLLFGDPFPRLRCRASYESWRDPTAWERLTPQTEVPTAAGGALVTTHGGSIAWNAYRKKWVAIFTQLGGDSPLGEIWCAQSDSPTGPWGAAVKVVTHKNYTFYNPLVHPELTPDGSPVLLFEGTYTATFADRPEPTPRHDYNQVMYRIDLDDPAFGQR